MNLTQIVNLEIAFANKEAITAKVGKIQSLIDQLQLELNQLSGMDIMLEIKQSLPSVSSHPEGQPA